MIGGAVAKRYATALYELAEEQKAVAPIGKQLASLVEAWESSEPLRAVFENPQVTAEERRGVITAVAKKAMAHPLLVQTLCLLSDRRRIGSLSEIAAVYERLAELRAGRVRAEIITAKALPEAYYQKLEKALEATTGKAVTLIRREDPSILGGVVTQVGSQVFDGSLRHRLQGLREQLLRNSKERGQAATE